MNLIFFLLLAFFSLSEVNGRGKLRVCLPTKENNENTDSIRAEKLLGETFREITSFVLPSAPKDEKIEFALDNDVIRAKGYAKNIGLINTNLNISVCFPFPTGIILNEIAIHGDEYYLNGTVADIFYIYGKGKLDITIKGLSVSVKNLLPDSFDLKCWRFNIDVKLQEWEANLGGIMGGDDLLEPTINAIFGDLGPDMIDFLWTSEYNKIAAVIQMIIDKYINPHLGDMDATFHKEGNLNNLEAGCKSYIIPIKK